MGAERDYGKKRPNGRKIAALRKKGEITQASLADKLDISERRLREIEKKDHPVPATIITAIAAELKVSLSEITLSIPDAPTSKTGPLLKLRAVRSATELSGLAKSAKEYDWGLQIDPTTATAADMQAVMKIVHRFVRKLGRECQHSVWGGRFRSGHIRRDTEAGVLT
jgi:transcriptional regulator with XRE-family HTH domain